MNKPTAKTIANLICGLLLGIANKNGLPIDSILTKNELLEMATLLENKKINNQGATQIIDHILRLKAEKTENINEEGQEINEKINNELDDKNYEEIVKIIELNIEEIAKELNVLQENDDKILTQIAQSVIENNPKQVQEYAQKPQILNFLVGQCMKTAKGQGNSQLFSDILKTKLEENLQNLPIEN